MTQDTRPFWQRPLPPIRRPGDDPLAERKYQDPVVCPSSDGDRSILSPTILLPSRKRWQSGPRPPMTIR